MLIANITIEFNFNIWIFINLINYDFLDLNEFEEIFIDYMAESL